MVPSAQSLILVTIAILFSGISYLVQTKKRKKVIREQLSSWLPDFSRGRRTSTSRTPPRSLTPEKKVPNNAPPPNAYKDIFPPSSRGNLPVWARSWTSILGAFKVAENGDTNQEQLKKKLIPWEADFRKCDSSTYTPMEITIGEVKALGDFLNYSKLSGVPLPQAYKEFEIEKAIPRPYRPFRWAYHQTMCKSWLCSAFPSLNSS